MPRPAKELKGFSHRIEAYARLSARRRAQWVALGLSALVTWLGIRNAFRPLRELRRAIARFEAGDRRARARLVGGDHDTRAVAVAVNDLWDQLERNNEIIAQQNRRLSALTAQVISAQEEERKRIARELHDEAGQVLTAVKIELDLDGHLDAGKRVGQALAQVRDLSNLLRPSALDDLGLVRGGRDSAGGARPGHNLDRSV